MLGHSVDGVTADVGDDDAVGLAVIEINDVSAGGKYFQLQIFSERVEECSVSPWSTITYRPPKGRLIGSYRGYIEDI